MNQILKEMCYYKTVNLLARNTDRYLERAVLIRQPSRLKLKTSIWYLLLKNLPDFITSHGFACILLGLQCATFIHCTEKVLLLTLFESNMNFPFYPTVNVSTNEQTKTP